jgi:hypothetical protein
LAAGGRAILRNRPTRNENLPQQAQNCLRLARRRRRHSRFRLAPALVASSASIGRVRYGCPSRREGVSRLPVSLGRGAREGQFRLFTVESGAEKAGDVGVSDSSGATRSTAPERTESCDRVEEFARWAPQPFAPAVNPISPRPTPAPTRATGRVSLSPQTTQPKSATSRPQKPNFATAKTKGRQRRNVEGSKCSDYPPPPAPFVRLAIGASGGGHGRHGPPRRSPSAQSPCR